MSPPCALVIFSRGCERYFAIKIAGKGGKNRRRGKNEGEEKRELIIKEEGQGALRDAPGCVQLGTSHCCCSRGMQGFAHPLAMHAVRFV